MPIKKRPRIAPTDSWQQRELLVEDPEQRAYEVMRTCVLFGQSPAERARQTGGPARSLYRMVERFDQLGMASLFVPANETPRRGPSLSQGNRPSAEQPALGQDVASRSPLVNLTGITKRYGETHALADAHLQVGIG